MKNKKIGIFIVLNLLLLLYSLISVFSKLASGKSFLSLEFILFYSAIILCLGIYAIGWQQIIKRLPLTVAYSNKAITVIWGLVYGVLLFSEKITVNKILGIIIIVIGVVLFSNSEEGDSN